MCVEESADVKWRAAQIAFCCFSNQREECEETNYLLSEQPSNTHNYKHTKHTERETERHTELCCMEQSWSEYIEY